MEGLPTDTLKTAKTYQIRLTFQMFFDLSARKASEAFLQRWYFWATHIRLVSIIRSSKIHQ